jgi:hypothetical protein
MTTLYYAKVVQRFPKTTLYYAKVVYRFPKTTLYTAEVLAEFLKRYSATCHSLSSISKHAFKPKKGVFDWKKGLTTAIGETVFSPPVAL